MKKPCYINAIGSINYQQLLNERSIEVTYIELSINKDRIFILINSKCIHHLFDMTADWGNGKITDIKYIQLEKTDIAYYYYVQPLFDGYFICNTKHCPNMSHNTIFDSVGNAVKSIPVYSDIEVGCIVNSNDEIITAHGDEFHRIYKWSANGNLLWQNSADSFCVYAFNIDMDENIWSYQYEKFTLVKHIGEDKFIEYYTSLRGSDKIMFSGSSNKIVISGGYRRNSYFFITKPALTTTSPRLRVLRECIFTFGEKSIFPEKSFFYKNKFVHQEGEHLYFGECNI